MSVGKIRKIENWEYWYDRSYKCWFAMPVDQQGNQIDDSINAYTRDSIEILIQKELEWIRKEDTQEHRKR